MPNSNDGELAAAEPVQTIPDTVVELLGKLSHELHAVHSTDSELHQLWLETEWLKSNLRSNQLCLPRNWELIIFRMVRENSPSLRKYSYALQTARDLADALRRMVPSC
jgi:hypothetical protein